MKIKIKKAPLQESKPTTADADRIVRLTRQLQALEIEVEDRRHELMALEKQVSERQAQNNQVSSCRQPSMEQLMQFCNRIADASAGKLDDAAREKAEAARDSAEAAHKANSPK